MTSAANSSAERLVAAGFAHSWPICNMQPNPPDWSHSRCTCALARSGVPITPAPASLMMSIISSTRSPGIVIWGKAATFWKYRNQASIPNRTSARACSSVSAM